MDYYIIALLKCKNIGNTKLYNYIKENNFDFNLVKSNISKLISNEDYINFDSILEEAKKEILKNNKLGINIITIFDRNFPKKLYTIKNPILYLYYKGNIELLNKKLLAIIGSRNVDKESEENAYKISKEFSKRDICIVSGLAVGIDTYAHMGSYKENGKTIAVLPSGLDKIIPTSNNKLASDILENGGLLVSEYSCGVIPTKYTFVKRDRVQSALSNIILVIKANEKSGTMHAVNCAFESNKLVYQLKGNNNSKISNNFDFNDYDLILDKLNDKQELIYIYTQESLF